MHPGLGCLPHFFLINYAIGGNSGWPIDLERYNRSSYMYVDYVHVSRATEPRNRARRPDHGTRSSSRDLSRLFHILET